MTTERALPTAAASSGTGVTPMERTVPALLQRQADRHGERPFLEIAGARWAHADAASAAACTGAALAAAGIARGDRVALMCGNRVETLEVFLGCGWIGAVSVPINTAAMGPQLAYVLADSGARLLVIEHAFLGRLAHADLGGTALETIWVIEDAATAQQASTASALGDGASVESPAPIESPATHVGFPILRPYPRSFGRAEAAALRAADPLAILYTSGTTGPAKGVVCPHGQFHAWGVNSARILGLNGDDVLATTLPLFHINALNTYAQAAVAGCRVVYLERFSASGFWPAMQAAEATVVYLLGAMVPILLAQPESAAERSHRVRLGLGPGVPAAAGAAFQARSGVTLIEGYGSTETNFVIATALDRPRPGTMGWLQAGFDARVVDENDEPVADGVAGELVLRADQPHAFAAGYFGRAEQTVEAWRNLWFHTGDRVVREADGAFRFIDRIKDAIRRRGENISSWEVEQVLAAHPAVAEVAVFPVRSELAEDEVMAALVARAGCTLEPAALIEHCAPRLPRYAVPRYLEVVAVLPRTENGKVQKFRLRERGVTAATWDREAGGFATESRAGAA